MESKLAFRSPNFVISTKVGTQYSMEWCQNFSVRAVALGLGLRRDDAIILSKTRRGL